MDEMFLSARKFDDVDRMNFGIFIQNKILNKMNKTTLI